MSYQDRISRRQFISRSATLMAGFAAFAAGCASENKMANSISEFKTPEPFQKWSRVEVPTNKGVYVPVAGLDPSNLNVTDLIVYSQSADLIVWFGVVLQNPYSNLPSIDFSLARFSDNFVVPDDKDLIQRPKREDITDQSTSNAVTGVTDAIPQNSSITITKPIDVLTPIAKPTDQNDYVLVFKGKDQVKLTGFVPIKFSFESSTKGIT